MDTLKKRLADVLEWKNLTMEGGHKNAPVQVEEMFVWLEKYGTFFASFVCNTTEYLSDAMNDGKSIIFEAQLGALRDIDFGIYPYTSASTTLAAYAPIGAGAPFAKLDESIGIMKAYSSCVGEGHLHVRCLEKKQRLFVWQAVSMVQQQEDQEESVDLMW